MQLDSYIGDLLFRYECVIIPEFGAFLTKVLSAHIDAETHAFHPPKKVVSFNSQLTTNDGLLANYIANSEKIPFETALKQLEKKAKSLKSSLAQGETLTFQNIGEMVLSNEGKITFEPTSHLNYLTESFGLSQFVSIPVIREVYKEEIEELEKVAPIAVTLEKRKSKPYLRYAAIALLALTIAGFTTSNFYFKNIEKHNQIAEEEAQENLENQIQEATFVIPNPLPSVTLNITRQSGNYHIVAGAFRIEENSNKKLEQLIGQGYSARKIGTNKYGLHQVVYSSYETRLEAQRALSKIKREHNRDAWLLIQKLN